MRRANDLEIKKPNPPVSLPKALSRQNRWVQLVLVATRDSKITKQTLTLVETNREKVAAGLNFCRNAPNRWRAYSLLEFLNAYDKPLAAQVGFAALHSRMVRSEALLNCSLR